MKKLLLGALLVMGSVSYGATTSVTVNITANVEPSGSIVIQRSGTTISELDYSKGEQEVLDVVFTGVRGGTLDTISLEKTEINMSNGTAEHDFNIHANVDSAQKQVTLEGQNMSTIYKGTYHGELRVNASYN